MSHFNTIHEYADIIDNDMKFGNDYTKYNSFHYTSLYQEMNEIDKDFNSYRENDYAEGDNNNENILDIKRNMMHVNLIEMMDKEYLDALLSNKDAVFEEITNKESIRKLESPESPSMQERIDFNNYINNLRSNEVYHRNLLDQLNIRKNDKLTHLLYENMGGLVNEKTDEAILYVNAEKIKNNSDSTLKSSKLTNCDTKTIGNTAIINGLYMSQMPSFFTKFIDSVTNSLPSKDSSVNYVQQMHLLSAANNALFQQIQNVSTENSMMSDRYVKLEIKLLKKRTLIDRKFTLEKKNSGSDSHKSLSMMSSDKKRRHRRTAKEIDRHYRCMYPPCSKAYGSEGSLNQHVKLKHPQHYASHMEESKYNELGFDNKYMNESILNERMNNKENENESKHNIIIERKEDKIVTASGMPNDEMEIMMRS